MEIGNVLLRDDQYVWRERVAVILKNALVLHPPTKPQTHEKFPLDGRFVCEAVVVSSAHLHSVQLHDIHTGKNFLVDAKSRGRKQVWMDIFRNAQRTASVTASWQSLSNWNLHAEGGDQHLPDTEQQEVVLDSPLLQEATGKLIRGSDLEGLLPETTDRSLASIGDQLVHLGVLEPCTCSCALLFKSEQIYRVNWTQGNRSEKNGSGALQRGHQHYQRSHQSWILNRVFSEVLKLFDADKEELSGMEIVQALVQNGAYNVPTAIAIAGEMIRQEIIQRRDESENMPASFLIDDSVKYKPGWFADDLDTGPLMTNPVMQTTRATNNDAFVELETQFKNLKERHEMIFNVFCFFCVLVLLDASSSAFPAPLKLTVVVCLLMWLILSDGTATLSINIQRSNGEQHGGIITAGFFSNLRTRTVGVQQMGNSLPDMKPIEATNAPLSTAVQTPSSQQEVASDMAMATIRSEETSGRVVSLDKASEAKVYSFRLAISQAASVPIELTHVFSDEYLFSVMSVKDRAFAYAVTKMARILEWRAKFGVNAITWEHVKGQLASGNMYWYGYDFQNRPILWVRPKLKDWKNMAKNREAEIRAHVFLIEIGCQQLMPPGCTTYTIVSNADRLGPTQVDLRLMHGLLDTCVANYPDRIGMVHAGPLNRFLRYITPLLWPFLPTRLRNKVSFMHDCVTDLSMHMKTELIPTHMGGTADHKLRANPSEDPNDVMEIEYMVEQQKQRMHALNVERPIISR